MNTLRTCVIFGILAMAAGCDTSNASAPAPAVDSGNGGGDAKVADGSGDGAAVVDSGSPGTDSTVSDGGGEAAVVEDSGSEAAIAADAAGEAAVVDAGGDEKMGDGGGDAKVEEAGSEAAAPDGGDAGGEAGSCVIPACLKTLNASCAPTGACTATQDYSSGSSYNCYANGITVGYLVNPAIDASEVTLSAKKAGAVCYSIAYNGNDIANQTPMTAIVTNGADAGVATLDMTVSADQSTELWSVTCAGGKAVALDPSCANEWPLSYMGYGGNSSCTDSTTCTW